jgi:uncharacterized protein YgiM (DUF1202 family)
LVVLFGACALVAAQIERVFSKSRDLPLRESPEPTSKTTCKAEWNEEMEVLETQGRWFKVKVKEGKGWVYGGRVSNEPCEDINKNNKGAAAVRASGMTATAAGRAVLSDKAKKYADEHDLNETAHALDWASKLNDKIGKPEIQNYLKDHQLGEYSKKP